MILSILVVVHYFESGDDYAPSTLIVGKLMVRTEDTYDCPIF